MMPSRPGPSGFPLAAVLALITVIAGCATAPSSDYAVHQAAERPVEFTATDVAGAVDPTLPLDVRGEFFGVEAAETGANTMYAGDYGAAGLLAQVLLHSGIEAGRQETRLAEARESADTALGPLQTVIRQLTFADIMPDEWAGSATGVYQVTSIPVFFVSEDLRRYSIKHVVTIREENSKETAYSNVIQLISRELPGKVTLEEIVAQNGSQIRSLFSNLYRRSVELAVADAGRHLAPAPGAREKTFRVHEGNRLRTERGTLLTASGSILLIRNLRGWLIEFPDQG